MYGVKLPEELADTLSRLTQTLQAIRDTDGERWQERQQNRCDALLLTAEGVLERFKKEQDFHQDRQAMVEEHDAQTT